ncbi:MAG: flavodoxin family protein [Brevinematia bacterium]
MLLVYEEANSSIDPWRKLFRDEITNEGFVFEECPAVKMKGKDLASYDVIIIYGAVMAFTKKEPIRDWLNAETNLSGRKVGLFVTANRWFLKEYFTELEKILEKKDVKIVDAVSSATKKLNEEEKRLLIRKNLQKLK